MTEILALEEINRVLSLPKFIEGPMKWDTRPNQSNFFECSFIVYDEVGATVPGVRVTIEYKKSPIVDECRYSFTLFMFEKGAKGRGYQIEVAPKEKKTHTDRLNPQNDIYGPHQHKGNQYEIEPINNNLCCEDFAEWFALFCERASIIYSGTIVLPPLSLNL